MSEMVERVAKAIYAVDGGKGWHIHEKFYMDAARAAIAAMRVPTPGALCAGLESIKPENVGEFSRAWREIFDAELAP